MGMSIFQTIILIGLSGNAVIGLLVWASNPKRKVNAYFMLTCILIIAWLVGMFTITKQSSVGAVTFWCRQVSAIAASLPLGFFILRLAVLQPDISFLKLCYKLRYFLFAVVSVVLLCNAEFFIQSAYFTAQGETLPHIVYGPGIILYLAYFAASAIGMIISVPRIFLKTTGVQRTASQFLLLGWLMGFIAGVVLFTTANLMGSQEANRFMPLVPLVMNSFVAYGIATRRILSVSVVVQRVVSYTLMTGYLSGIYFLIVWTGRIVIRPLVADPTYLSHLLAALVVAFSVAPAHGWMQAVSQRLFASHRAVNLDEVLTRASQMSQEVTTANRLTSAFARLVEQAFETADAILLMPSQDETFEQVYPPVPGGGSALRLRTSDALVQLLLREHQPLTVDVLERMWPSAQVVCAREEIAATGAAAITGGFIRKELRTLLILPPKMSAAIYDARDQHALQLLCDQYSVALENARLYTEVQNSKIYNDILIDSLASGMAAVNAGRMVTVFNQQAQKLTGLTEYKPGATPLDRLPEPMPELLDTLLTSRAGFRDREINLRLGAGHEMPVRISGSVFHGYAGDLLGALLIFNDLTTLKKMEEHIRRADRLSSIGTLSAGMAHEIKNPLVTIKTFTQLLPKQHDDPDFQRTFFNLVGQEVQRIDTIVNRLLKFARPTAVALSRISLHDVVENSLQLTGQQMVQRNIRLEQRLDAPSFMIQGDAEQLNQTFVNFFLNAVQAIGENGTLTVRTACIEGRKAIPLIRDAQPPRIEVEIRDTGCGIAPDDIPRIFDPFFTTKSDGVGLGLSISHGIIQEHDGTVEVESEKGKGTVFRLHFPLAEDEEGPIA